MFCRASAPQRLPSVEDTSDTLPTAVDKQLWDQEHQQTLQQQELQRQRSTAPLTVTACLTQAAVAEAASAPAVCSAGNRLPGYTGTSSALSCHITSVDAAGQQSGDGSPQDNQSAGRQGQWLQSALYKDAESASYYVGEDSTQGPGQYIGNIHSTLVSGSSSPLVLG